MVTTQNSVFSCCDLNQADDHTNNIDSRVEELLAAVQLLQTQNAEQQQQNEEELLCSQALVVRDATVGTVNRYEEIHLGVGGYPDPTVILPTIHGGDPGRRDTTQI